MAETKQLALTPTESLIIEVLVARFRLGDTLWTFDSRHKNALRKLEKNGLIYTLPGQVEKTARASLTDHALFTFGAQWFMPGQTLKHLPEPGTLGADLVDWSKPHIAELVELPQHNCHLSPETINVAHLLMMRMINRHHPVYRVSTSAAETTSEDSVVLTRGSVSKIEIFRHGPTFRLTRRGIVSTTSSLSDVLYFTSIDTVPNEPASAGKGAHRV